MRLYCGADGKQLLYPLGLRSRRNSFHLCIAGFAPWFSYIPYVLLVALPTILEAKERRTWLR